LTDTTTGHILTTAECFSWLWTKWKKLNDLDAGTKNTKLFTREFPQDNINASFLKPKTVETKSMGFVSRRKKMEPIMDTRTL
jgi:hypothetical protein